MHRYQNVCTRQPNGAHWGQGAPLISSTDVEVHLLRELVNIIINLIFKLYVSMFIIILMIHNGWVLGYHYILSYSFVLIS